MSVKLYQSEKWLRRRYLLERMTAKEIGVVCGVTEMTIDRYLDKFALKKNRRKLKR